MQIARYILSLTPGLGTTHLGRVCTASVWAGRGSALSRRCTVLGEARRGLPRRLSLSLRRGRKGDTRSSVVHLQRTYLVLFPGSLPRKVARHIMALVAPLLKRDETRQQRRASFVLNLLHRPVKVNSLVHAQSSSARSTLTPAVFKGRA